MDFAKRRTRRRKPRASKSTPATFSVSSFAAGIAAGVGLFLLGAYLPELLSRAADDTAADPIRPATADGPATPARRSVEFVFRDLLDDASVPTDPSLYPTPQPRVSAGLTASPVPAEYLLQSGSFRILADAERRRGELLLLDLPARVTEAEVNGRIWYRVLVGPYDRRGEAQQVEQTLRERQIAAIWLERPNPQDPAAP